MGHELYRLLRRLDDARIAYHLGRHRPDTVRVCVAVPGERIEIDVFDDGHVEISRFKGNESVESAAGALRTLYQQLEGERG